MRIAAISDIHSNVYALSAVLDDIKHRKVNITVNLGDILYGPIAPRKTYDLLMENEIVTIGGNQDRQIYQSDANEIESNPTLAFIIEDLGPEPLHWMKQLPPTFQLNSSVFLCHGTPQDDLVYLLEDVTDGSPKLRSDNAISKLLDDQYSDVVLCGHTHIPRCVRLSSGQLIVNPGSVGLPAYTDEEPVMHSMENYSYHASYAILQQCHGHWQVEHIKVPYDVESAMEHAKSRGREDWAHFLSTGRKQPD